MRLMRKVLLAFGLGNLVIVAVSAYVEVRREISLFDSDMREDGRALASSVAAAALELWDAEGESAALDLVRAESDRAGSMQVRWVWLDEETGGNAPRVPASALGPLRRGAHVSAPLQATDGGSGVLYTYVPIRTPSGRLAAIETGESLAGRDDYLRTTMTAALAIALTIVVLSVVLSAVLGVLLVGRPTRLLVEKARRIGEGDLTGPLHLGQRDELSVLADELNAVCERLRLSGERAQAEAAARTSAVEQLRHADRLTTVGKLASGIAHELGTPLNVVGGRATMIATREVDGDEAADSARIIAEQARRMTAIIRQLLDFARRRAAKKEARDLVAVAGSAQQLLAHLAEKGGVTLTASHQVPSAVVPVDDGQIHQAVTNLVVNAIQATPRGGAVTLEVSRGRQVPPAEMGAAALDCCCLSVVDTGQGMDADTLARVFEPFFTTKGVGEGTGLGLPVAHGIVREHGGWITAESQVGRGSRFTIHLPGSADE